MSYTNLVEWYRCMFILRHYHKYSDVDMLAWLPFERQIYLEMLLKAIDEEKKSLDKLGGR